MSRQTALAFRDQVLQSTELQKAVRAATGGGNQWDWAALVALGEKNGLTFTAEEARSTMNEMGHDELSEFELELAAGGANPRALKAAAEDSNKKANDAGKFSK